ncbi:MAG: beta-ribofuranosylaminobenzene 5'-phosphate synthase family protein [Hyphomicrobiaceae bacterium]
MSTTSDQSVVHVVAPARLHMGFLDLSSAFGRKFGGIGLSLEKPCTQISVQKSTKTEVIGRQQETRRITQTIAKLRPLLGLENNYRVHVEDLIPAHSGLGSGTQLAITLAKAIVQLENQDYSATELAIMLNRGGRSAIGIAAFDRGGFIVEGGRGPLSKAPPILMQTNFPENWRVLLVLDPHSKGVYGSNEQHAFATLPPLPEADFARICHLVLMQLMPGLIERDISAFGQAVTEIQSIVGRQFSVAQNGSPWTNPKVGALIERLQEAGAVGIGQSSWGPTGFAFAPSTSEANSLYYTFVEDAKSEGLELFVVAGRNDGARIVTKQAVAPNP